MPDAKPTILLSHEMLQPMQPLLDPAYHVVRLWDYPDRLAFVEGVGQSVQAIVHAGEHRLEPGMLAEMSRLGLIACVSVGYDGVDIPWCRAHGIAVTHAPSLNADDVADHAVGALIAVWRGLVEGDHRVRDGRWQARERLGPRRSLTRKRGGIVGLGGIGEATARRLEAFGMQIAWWGPHAKPDARWPRASSLLELARESDVLVVAARADAANHHMINQAVIEALGPRGCLVNVARGSVVDEDALIAALKDGRLGMAALDVFEQEPTPAARWKDVPNTVLTPHTAGATVESAPQMVAMCIENLRCFFHGEPLASPVGGSIEPRSREPIEEYR